MNRGDVQTWLTIGTLLGFDLYLLWRIIRKEIELRARRKTLESGRAILAMAEQAEASRAQFDAMHERIFRAVMDSVEAEKLIIQSGARPPTDVS